MIGRDVRVGAAEDFVGAEPFWVQGTEYAQRTHRVTAEEDVVYDAFEVESVKI